MKTFSRILMLGFAIATFAVLSASVWQIAQIKNEYRIGDTSYQSLMQQTLSASALPDTAVSVSAEAAEQATAEKEAELEEPNRDEETAELEETEAEGAPLIQIPEIDFPALLAMNPEIKAWLLCEDSVISYPVLQTEDNDYYLTHLPDRKENANGALFLDFRVNGNLDGLNSVIYGHHMKSGAMFASLVNYKAQEYFDSHSYMLLLTPKHAYELRIFSAFETPADGEVYTFGFPNLETYEEWLQEMKRCSCIRADFEPDPERNTVTLSTCDYEFYNARFVVLGQLIEIK